MRWGAECSGEQNAVGGRMRGGQNEGGEQR